MTSPKTITTLISRYTDFDRVRRVDLILIYEPEVYFALYFKSVSNSSEYQQDINDKRALTIEFLIGIENNLLASCTS